MCWRSVQGVPRLSPSVRRDWHYQTMESVSQVPNSICSWSRMASVMRSAPIHPSLNGLTEMVAQTFNEGMKRVTQCKPGCQDPRSVITSHPVWRASCRLQSWGCHRGSIPLLTWSGGNRNRKTPMAPIENCLLPNPNPNCPQIIPLRPPNQLVWSWFRD